ncbi:hypothetical protein L6164_014954 [Bauhinia variegata]|uniref:Uncharacterized protein n=1 Tax=Bauhinia variegata TaxID=167791 RepID=A0ACB9NNW3_BAUVA|nr:hypothetical protein L6164_014954 [Bauhinia variegata]
MNGVKIRKGMGVELSDGSKVNSSVDLQMENERTGSTSAKPYGSEVMSLVANSNRHQHLCQKGNLGVASENDTAVRNPNSALLDSVGKYDHPFGGNERKTKRGYLSFLTWEESFQGCLLQLLQVTLNGSSCIRSSVKPQFLSAFSAAVGRKSLQYFDSEEYYLLWFLPVQRLASILST